MNTDIQAHRILILDFGSQTTQLIARRIREASVYSEVHPYDMSDEAIQAFDPKGIILSGGPESLTVQNAPRASKVIYTQGCPILGICYGTQLLADELGGKIQSVSHREFGFAQLKIQDPSNLLNTVKTSPTNTLNVWMSHGDQIVQLPTGFKTLASTDTAPIAVIADTQRHFYGLLFHPEVTHTEQGHKIIERFVKDICQCASLWTSQHIIEAQTRAIREQVGKDNIILGLSGGVDSAVAAALIHRALDDDKHQQLTCIFIDNGLLRQNEAEQVMEVFAKQQHMKVVLVDAKKQFLTALKGISDPEEKRKAVGRVFYEVFEQESAKYKDAKWLAQGTIYPDVIESAAAKTGKAHVIKTHHNVGGLPKNIKLKLLEPLRELFKDEVRKVGVELGLPKDLVYRHPFPGPGLAVRVLGEIKEEHCELVRKADAIFMEELHKADLYNKVSQAFAVFLPIRSVAVLGDARTYEHVIALRAVETTDFMTAKWAQLPHDFIGHVANRITNEVKGIARVVYDISSKPPATIEWE